MINFNEIIGHDDVVEHLVNSIKMKKVSNAYLLSGEAGAGKKTIAMTFAAALLCEKQTGSPCMECDSCKRALGKNHPDIIVVGHEKPGSIGVDDVREALVNDISIRPYQSAYKVYIIPDANLMTVQAQNAILKTIEEPPEYAVILLLTNSRESLLQTIRSRCVSLELKVVEDELVKKYLMEHLHIPDYQAELDASFAHGSIGRAKEAAESREFSEIIETALKLLRNIDSTDTMELGDVIKTMAEEKQKITEYLDIFTFWFRDVLLFKATREVDKLVFKQEINNIKEQANERSYENLESILESIDKTRIRLNANVNTEIALELLFLTIRER